MSHPRNLVSNRRRHLVRSPGKVPAAPGGRSQASRTLHAMLCRPGLQWVLAFGSIVGTDVALAQHAVRGVSGVAHEGHSVQSFVLPAGELTLILDSDRDIAAISYARADGRISLLPVARQRGEARQSRPAVLGEAVVLRCIKCNDDGAWGMWVMHDSRGESIGYLTLDRDGDLGFSLSWAK